MNRTRQRLPRRGIFLISVLLTTMLVAMFIGAAISLSPSALGRSAKSNQLLSAHNAAASGIEYALARLQKDPTWSARVPYALNEPDLTVREDQGNVIGLVRSADGGVAQFRIRFNLENGTPAGDPDQVPNSTAPMTIDYPYVSYSNVGSSSDFTLPAVGGTPALVVPARSIYLAVEGRCGRACNVLTAANFNADLSADFSHKSMRAVYKITNIGQNVAAAAAMSAGKITATLSPDTSDKVSVDSVSGVPALRTKKDLSVTGGNVKNLIGVKQGDLRIPTAATPVYNGLNKLTRKDESPSDAFYALKWSDVRQASGVNTLTAGTYVWYDDGSLHYYDMKPADYVDWVTANPLDLGTTVYTQSGGQTALTSSVNVTSTGTGASLQTQIIVHQDTKVIPSATGTAELGILPRKGAAESPPPGGAGTGTTTQFQTAIQGAFIPATPGKFTPNPAALTWMGLFGPWAAANGYGTWSGGQWQMASVSLEPGFANTDIPPTAWGTFQTAVNAYLAGGGTPPGGVTFTAGATAPGAVSGPVAASLADANNIKVDIRPSGGATSAVLSSDASMTLGAKVTGSGASLVSGVDIKLVGLGINLAATPNSQEGVSVYAKRNVFMSALDATANKFHDISLKGVVYAQGNVDVLLGAPGFVAADWGKFHLNGVMVAYGGDPALAPNPLSTSGKITITAKDQQLKFDASYLSNLLLGGGVPANAQYGVLVGRRVEPRGFSLAEMMLAMALAAVAVLTLIALSLSALRSERKSSDSLVGQMVATEALQKLVYDAQANSAHPIWAFSDSVNPYAVETAVSSETNFTLVTYDRDVDPATFTPRRLKRVELVAHWWGSENSSSGRTGMGQLEAHAIGLVREQ